MQPDASVEDYLPVWRKVLKRTKQIRCHMCKEHKATSIPSMKYHFTRCGKVGGARGVASFVFTLYSL